MTVFAGHYGQLELKRFADTNALNLNISKSDLDVSRKRFTLSDKNFLDIQNGTITTGDRVSITTEDSRGLPFRLFTNLENTEFIDNPKVSNGYLPIEFFANVDAMGAIRMYRSFADAIANSGENYLAIPLTVANGSEPWSVSVNLLPGAFNSVGKVLGFEISTERETVDTTSLGDAFRGFSNSGISGSGKVDCLFDFKNFESEEVPLAIAQLVQKIEIGSRFLGRFYLLEPSGDPPPGFSIFDGVFYELNGLFVRSSFVIRADLIAECSFDFITSGEFILQAGATPVPITTEDDVNIVNETTLEDLGVLNETD